MGNIKEFYSLQRVVEAYRSKLHVLPESQFAQTPPAGGWSASEVYAIFSMPVYCLYKH